MTIKQHKTESSILQGMKEAVEYSAGNKNNAIFHKVAVEDIDVREARIKLGFTQEYFANTFGISKATLQNWEQGRRKPTGAAKVLLNIINTNPEAVMNAIDNNAQ